MILRQVLRQILWRPTAIKPAVAFDSTEGFRAAPALEFYGATHPPSTTTRSNPSHPTTSHPTLTPCLPRVFELEGVCVFRVRTCKACACASVSVDLRACECAPCLACARVRSVYVCARVDHSGVRLTDGGLANVCGLDALLQHEVHMLVVQSLWESLYTPGNHLGARKLLSVASRSSVRPSINLSVFLFFLASSRRCGRFSVRLAVRQSFNPSAPPSIRPSAFKSVFPSSMCMSVCLCACPCWHACTDTNTHTNSRASTHADTNARMHTRTHKHAQEHMSTRTQI